MSYQFSVSASIDFHHLKMNLFRPVKSGKVSELIGLQIKNMILSGSLKAGDRLPPERELVLSFQASRISVREALKSLEASGLLSIRPGSGVFVAEITSRPMSESLSSFLRIQKASLNELTDARIILEPTVATLAAERIKKDCLLKLEENIQETLRAIDSHSPSRTSSKNIEFHCLIAESTENPVIALTMKTLFDVVKEMTIELEGNLSRRKTLSVRAVSCHQEILEALRERDAANSSKLMLNHILEIQEGLRKIQSSSLSTALGGKPIPRDWTRRTK